MGQLDPAAQRILNERNGAQAQPAQPAQPQAAPMRNGAPGVIQGPTRAPDPMEVEGNARDQRNFQEGLQNTDFSQVGQLRGEFRKLQSYSDYTTALGTLNSALTTSPDAQGDQSLITSYAKMLDPNSAVREGEFATTAGTENQFNQLRARIARELGVDGGGMLSEDGRRRVRAEMRNLVEQRFRPAYERDRADYTGLAQEYGYNPALVVGTDPFTSYETRFNEYFGQQQGGGNGAFVPVAGEAQQQPTQPELQNMTMRDMYPNGAELNMDTWGRDEPFDAMQYLQDTFGISQSDERRLVGALNSRMGDASFSADDVRRIYGALEMPLPTDADIEQIVNDVHAGSPFGGIDTSAAEAEYKGMLDQRISQGGGNPEATAAGVGQGAVQGITFGMGDEIRGIGGALNAAINGQSISGGYQAERDLARRENERAREASPVAYTASEITGGLVTGGVRAAPATMRAANPLGAAVREGAILGGAAGFGYGEGVGGSTVGAATGAVTGAVTGGALQKAAPLVGKGVNALRGKRPDAAEVMPVMQAGERRGLTVRRANVDPSVRGQRANVLQGDKREIIRSMEAQDAADMGAVLLRDTGGGRPRTRTETGEMAAGAIERQRAGMKTRAGALYTRADNAAGGVTIAAPRAVAAIDAEIARLERASASGNKAMIGFLREQRDELANGSTIAGLRDRRTDLRSQLTERNLDANRREAAMQKIYDELSADISQGLAQSGNKRAQRAYAEADRVWRERAEFTKEVREKLLGKRGDKAPGNVASAIKTMAASDPDRLRRFIDVLDPDELADFRATTAQSLGSDGNNRFSVATFLSNTSGGNGRTAPLMDPRSMRLVFGKEGMEAIADLRVIGKSMMDAADGTNTSNTGGIVRRATNGLRTLMYGALGLSEGGMTGGALAMGVGSLINKLGEGRSVRMLTNPDFTKWLRTLPNSNNPQAIDGAFDRLRRVASRNSVFAADVQALERQLIGAANDNAGNLSGVAANEDPEQQN